MRRMFPITAGGTMSAESAAVDLLGTDCWDENGTTSVYLPADVAPRILKARGWTMRRDDDPRYGWTSPEGRHFWATDEALTVALIAEATS
jgi:hypothetical protein